MLFVQRNLLTTEDKICRSWYFQDIRVQLPFGPFFQWCHSCQGISWLLSSWEMLCNVTSWQKKHCWKHGLCFSLALVALWKHLSAIPHDQPLPYSVSYLLKPPSSLCYKTSAEVALLKVQLKTARFSCGLDKEVSWATSSLWALCLTLLL